VNSRNVHIDRLEIRLRGVSAEAARASTEGLGRALLEELAGRTAPAPHVPRQADGGTEGVRQSTSRGEEAGGANALRHLIAREVAATVRERLK
jgi:hypothetical protein